MGKEPLSAETIPFIAKLALKNRLISKEDLFKSLTACQGAGNFEKKLVEYFISSNLISKVNIKRLLIASRAINLRQNELKFGIIAIKKGYINKGVLQLVLDEQKKDIQQKKKPRMIGDLLIEAGMITDKQRDEILLIQKRGVKKPQDVTQDSSHQAPSDSEKRAEQVTETPLSEKKESELEDSVNIESAKSPGTEKQDKDKALEDNEEKTGSKIDGDDETIEENKGSHLMEPIDLDGGLELQISSDFLAAFLRKTEKFDKSLSVEDIQNLLIEKGVVYGFVADEMIDGFIKSSGFKTKAFRVAKGVKPVQGIDAKIEYFFNIDHLKAGGLDKDGNIDFKDRGAIPLVEEGTVLAEKTPAVIAKNGINLFGEELLATAARDINIKFGKGAKLSEDGLKVLADVSGYPKFSLSNVIFVHEEYVTNGDVDYETGHVEYAGNIVIKGCIKSGFKVSGNDIHANELDGGIIEAEGDLKIAGGINEGKVYAKGNVYAKFIHKSRITCLGDIYCVKEIVDSELECSGACHAEAGKIISSQIQAKTGVFVKGIGTQTAGPSVLRIGHDPFIEKELKKNRISVHNIKNQIEKLVEKQNNLKESNKEIQLNITEAAHVQDRSQLEQREINSTILSLKEQPDKTEEIRELSKKIETLKQNAMDAEEKLNLYFDKSESLEREIERIEEAIEVQKSKLEDLDEEKNNLVKIAKDNPGNPVVKASGTIMPETVIIGPHSEKRIKEEIRYSTIKEVPVSSEGMTSMGLYEMRVMSK